MANLTGRNYSRSYYPFAMIDNFRQNMDSVFDDYDSFRRNNYQNLYSGSSSQFYDKNGYYLVSMDIPGVDKDAINIEYSDNILTISAKRDLEEKDEDHTSSYHSQYYQSFSVPSSIDEDKIKAIYENGVLKVAMPKLSKNSNKKIRLTEDKDKGFFKKLFSSDNSNKIDIDTNH